MGESGSGKDTLVDAVCEKYGYKKLISFTTRQQRNTKDDEKSHIFITKEELRRLDNIVAYTFFNGNEYCATKEQIDMSDFYIIDCAGIKYLMHMYHQYHGTKEIVVVYVKVSKEDRFLRMRNRDGTVKAMERIKYDETAFNEVESLADIIIENNDKDITDAVTKLRDIIEGELCV